MIESLFIINFLFVFLEFYKPLSLSFRKLIYFIFCTLLVLYDGLRWNIGVDWESYYSFFNTFSTNTTSSHVLSRIDPLFQAIVQFSNLVFDGNYTFYLLFFSFCSYGLLFFSLSRLTQYSLLPLTTIFALFVWYSGSQRQFLAISILSVCLCLFQQKKSVNNFIRILLVFSTASLIHSSSIVFLPIILLLYFLKPKYLDYRRFLNFPIISRFHFCLLMLLLILTVFITLNPVSFISYLFVLIPIKSQGWVAYTLNAQPIDLSIFGLPRKIITLLFFVYLTSFIRKSTLSMPQLLSLYSPLFSLILYGYGIIVPTLNLSSRFDLYNTIILGCTLLGLLSNLLPRLPYLLLVLFTFANFTIGYFRFSCIDLFHPYYFFFQNSIPDWNGCTF